MPPAPSAPLGPVERFGQDSDMRPLSISSHSLSSIWRLTMQDQCVPDSYQVPAEVFGRLEVATAEDRSEAAVRALGEGDKPLCRNAAQQQKLWKLYDKERAS